MNKIERKASENFTADMASLTGRSGWDSRQSFKCSETYLLYALGARFPEEPKSTKECFESSSKARSGTKTHLLALYWQT